MRASLTFNVLFDFQMVFMTLDHKMLLDKMKCIGFLDKTRKRFHSYLTTRAFFCFIRQCVFVSRDYKLQISSGIYIKTFIAFAIYN